MTNVDLSHIFEKTETDKTTKDIYSEMSNEELAKKAEEVENADNEEYIKDINDYFTEEEQVDLVERGIHLTTAKEYHLETNGKKPVWNNTTTKKFKAWLHKTHPDREKYLIEDDTNNKETLSPLQLVIQNQKKKKDEQELEEQEQENNNAYNLLRWLYKFMSKFKFDFVPTDEEIKIIEDIKELIDNE